MRPPPRIGVLAVVLAVLLLVAACSATLEGHGSTVSAPPSSSPTTPTARSAANPDGAAKVIPPQPVASFVDCAHAFKLNLLHFPAGRMGHLQIGCALVKVPLNYAEPNGRQISLIVVRVHDTTDTRPIGQLLVNPGGPGASGANFVAQLASEVSNKVFSHFDLIGFDPRGVGSSTPIRCLSNTRIDMLNAASPDVLTTSGFAQARATAKSVAKACSSRYGSALAYFNTVETARDMDQIRQAVDDPKLNYLGFSYGTELGSVYAHLYPHTIRAMVLDGAVDPLTGEIASDTDQLAGFEGAFDQFAKYCVDHAPCRSIGNPRRAVHALQVKAAAHPIPSRAAGQSRRATVSLVDTGVLQALYSRSLWPTLGRALVAARQDDSARLLSLADQYNERLAGGRYTNIADINATIGCNDSEPGPSTATIRATARRWATRFPLFGSDFAPALFTCQQWQPNRTVPPRPTAATTKTVLVIGNKHDPATPYQGAVDLTRTMGHAQLLSWNGEGHTSYLQGSTCVDRYVDDYLVAGTLPPTNRTCPA